MIQPRMMHDPLRFSLGFRFAPGPARVSSRLMAVAGCTHKTMIGPCYAVVAPISQRWYNRCMSCLRSTRQPKQRKSPTLALAQNRRETRSHRILYVGDIFFSSSRSPWKNRTFWRTTCGSRVYTARKPWMLWISRMRRHSLTFIVRPVCA